MNSCKFLCLKLKTSIFESLKKILGKETSCICDSTEIYDKWIPFTKGSISRYILLKNICQVYQINFFCKFPKPAEYELSKMKTDWRIKEREGKNQDF